MSNWPEIPYSEWEETCSALHLFAQIVGKVRLSLTPWQNHSWHATLYVSPRGLTTGPIYWRGGSMTLSFDFKDSRVIAENADGYRKAFSLEPMSVSAFHENVKSIVAGVGGVFSIHGAPNELPVATPFVEDTVVRPWDKDAVHRFHGALLSVVPVFQHFQTSFLGKVSPVHLFWGSFDLASTRFSGRRAPMHPGGIQNLPDPITHEAYDHEVSSSGFWPGNGGMGEAMFYSYAYPEPDGFATKPVKPDAARWDDQLGEFLLPYEAVRKSIDPEAALMAFLQSTYDAAADCAGWDRQALDCDLQRARVPRTID